MPDTEIPGGYPQFERIVETIPRFNGANCLVVIDVTNVGAAAVADWRQGPMTTGLTDSDLAQAIVRELDAELARACPEGAVKVELQYHYSPKPIDVPKGRTRLWQQQRSIEEALRQIGQRQAPQRIKKLYLKGCYSDGDIAVVDAAFSIPGVEHVVTVDDIIYLLPPGTISGADDGFRPNDVGITVWKRENGRQIAQKSSERVDSDERFNIHTNAIENISDPITGPCPTVRPISGSVSSPVISGSLASVDAFIASITPSHAEYLARGTAGVKADEIARTMSCPNPNCQKKSVTTPVITNLHFTRVQGFWLSLVGVQSYTGYLNFDWSSNVVCQ